ncbi:MAG: hypothetical protein D6765_11870 [Bacteroidetes bacterium]|nr:MAG: hypothetical protein D6765_11870 [Bacteroidota bacterium]
MFFGIVLFVWGTPIAQTVTISEPLSLRDDSWYELLGDLKGNLLVYRDKGTEFNIFALDRRMQRAWEKELDLDKKRPEVLSVLPARSQAYFSLIYKFKQKGDLCLKAHKYDPGANLLDSATIKNFGSLFYTPNFEVLHSENREVVLLYYTEGTNEIHALAFHLGRMELLWETTLAPNDIILGRDFQQILINDAGDMFCIFNKDNRRSKQEEHRFEIFAYGPTTDHQLLRMTVGMQNHLTFDVLFTYDNLNHHLVAGGLYSQENLGRSEGFFFLTLDPKRPEQPALRFHPFDEEFMATLEEKEEKKVKGLSEVVVQEIILRRDGGALLICELSHVFERRGTAMSSYYNGGGNYIRDYYYDDIFVISLHPDGAIHWKNILHKKQYSQDDEGMFSSYFLLKTPTALRFIFNDEIKPDNTVSEYVLRGDGQMDRNAVMSTENQNLRLRFRDGVQVAANALVVPSERRNRLKLVKIVFEDRPR